MEGPTTEEKHKNQQRHDKTMSVKVNWMGNLTVSFFFTGCFPQLSGECVEGRISWAKTFCELLGLPWNPFCLEIMGLLEIANFRKGVKT